jgi:dipeptidyl-peptidase 4
MLTYRLRMVLGFCQSLLIGYVLFCPPLLAKQVDPFAESPRGHSEVSLHSSAPVNEPQRQRTSGRVFRDRVVAHWMADKHRFWYRNELSALEREYILVDAVSGKRERAFDHMRIARALGNDVVAEQLSIDRLDFDAQGKLNGLLSARQYYKWEESQGILTPSAIAELAVSDLGQPARQPSYTGAETNLTFVNRLNGPAEIFWISEEGKQQSYGKVDAGSRHDQHTFGGHRWRIDDSAGRSLGIVVADDIPSEVIIDGRQYENARRESPRRRGRASANGSSPRGSGGISPDGKWRATIENDNLVIRDRQSDNVVMASTDGSTQQKYEQLEWSPDSSSLVSFRIDNAKKLDVHLVRSSPEQGGRAVVESHPYSLPGDPFSTHEVNLFRLADKQQLKPVVDRFEHEWNQPNLRFSQDGQSVFYQQIDRGHQRFRLIKVELATGEVSFVIDERTESFIWTTHTENQSLSILNWLDDSDQLLWATEKNGWRQLILLDASTGQELRELTPPGIVIRGIEQLDSQQRVVWFMGCGREGQDPYHLHYGYVELDSGRLVWLTEGNGTHAIEFSPDRSYVIDTYSRVDAAPQIELRRVSDGSLVCELERADVRQLSQSGWTAPEVFVAKGRDGQTDIWGIICRPRDFDPHKKYPVLEDIYAGPHGSHVPKSFSATQRYQSLNELGFIVVKIDGMGTANRSKAFHDVCWRNLKDAGFPDRIAWLKAAAALYPELDLERVGIYGTSAGGQNAAGALLFHGDFYKVAVAACGCHDNRLDKASWNEQWMGYPVGPHYAQSSNIDNAAKLEGKLLLIVGEVDTNVPPESTMRFVDALIRANKDFDLLVVPNAGHGMGGGYGQRRMHNFFVQHLLE